MWVCPDHVDCPISPRPRHAITSGSRSNSRSETFALHEPLQEGDVSLPCPSPAVFLLGLESPASRQFDDSSFLKILLLDNADQNDLQAELLADDEDESFSKSEKQRIKKHGLSSLEMTWLEHQRIVFTLCCCFSYLFPFCSSSLYWKECRRLSPVADGTKGPNDSDNDGNFVQDIDGGHSCLMWIKGNGCGMLASNAPLRV